jgi:hypothetical protein
MNVVYLTREEWGADPNLPRLGSIVPPAERTEVYIHHTVGVDSDATPNVWETMDECKVWMRRLQTIRPDLGLDVPYNFVVFLMPDQLVIMEGRGVDRRGAHTAYHNRTALAWAFHGNFMLPTFGLKKYLPYLGYWIHDLKVTHSLVNLGAVRPALRDVFGHRDSGAYTSCCGDYLYDELGLIRIEEEDMPLTDDDVQRVAAAVIDAMPSRWAKAWAADYGGGTMRQIVREGNDSYWWGGGAEADHRHGVLPGKRPDFVSAMLEWMDETNAGGGD